VIIGGTALVNSRDEILSLAVNALYDAKALDMTLLDLSGLASFRDGFVIASASSKQHLDSLGTRLYHALKDAGKLPRVSGKADSGWVVVDLGDLVVHLFLESSREFYELEEFWHEAEQLEVEEFIVQPEGPLGSSD
jgi:ribosome-associated protein